MATPDTASVETLSSWAAPYVTGYLSQGQALTTAPYQAYTGQMVSGPSTLQQQAFQGLAGLTLPGAYQQAGTAAQQAIQGYQNLQYSPTQYTNQFQAPNQYQTGTFNAGFNYAGPGQATQFTNQYTGTGQYTPTQFGNQYQSIGNFNPTSYQSGFNYAGPGQATQFTNQFNAPSQYQTGQFNANFDYSGPSAATQFSNQFQRPQDFQAGNITTGTWDQAAAQQYMNPYLMEALNPQLDEARRQAEQTRMTDAARLTQAGAFGGSRQALMESELNRNTLRNMADITGKGYLDAYNTGMQGFMQDQGRSLQARQATEQSRQFAAGQNLTAAQLQAQFGLSAQQAQEAARQFNDSQRLSAAGTRSQLSLQAQQMGEQSRQFGAQQQMTGAQLQAQFGLSAQQAQEAARQFNSGQVLTAAQLQAQFGMDAQKASDLSQQFAYNAQLQQAQQRAQFGLAGLQATEQSRQFGAQQQMSADQLRAQYGLSAQQATEAARQFNSGQVLTAAQLQAQFGMDAQKAQELSRQFAAQQQMQANQLYAQYGMDALTAGEQSRQFGANYGLAGLAGQLTGAQTLSGIGQNQLDAYRNIFASQLAGGSQQRDMTNEALKAEYDQFREERAWPYEQLRYQKELMSGLPFSTTLGYGGSDPFADAIAAASGLGSLVNGVYSPTEPAKT